MNTKSPNNLGESIRIANSDFAEINIVEFDGHYYATDSNVRSFMEDNKITDTESVLKSVKEFNSINEITVLDESVTDRDLMNIRACMMICESLNPFAVAKAAKGRSLLRSVGGKIKEFVTGNEYDEAADIKKCLKRCDKALEDIAEEKKKIKSGKNTDQLKFSAMFIFNIAKTLFIDICLPKILSEKLKIPALFEKVFGKEAVRSIQNANKNSAVAKVRKGAGIAMTVYDLAVDLPPDIKGLYMSFKDYNELLDDYETEIRDMQRDLKRQLGKIERSKEMKGMVEFVEDTDLGEPVSVSYQSPEDLKVKNDHTPDVVHDDNTQQMEAPKPEIEVPNPFPEEEPAKDPQMEKPVSVPPTEFSPLDAINQAKQDPRNVPVARYCDKYYIDHNDLRCYMDACGEQKYESAVDKIISAYNDPKFCRESVKIVIGNNDLSSLNSEVKSAMEASSVEFQVYSTRKKD